MPSHTLFECESVCLKIMTHSLDFNSKRTCNSCTVDISRVYLEEVRQAGAAQAISF